jgi:hypothetical protein
MRRNFVRLWLELDGLPEVFDDLDELIAHLNKIEFCGPIKRGFGGKFGSGSKILIYWGKVAFVVHRPLTDSEICEINEGLSRYEKATRA